MNNSNPIKRNVCFIANYNKTFFFHEIAKKLNEDNFNIYWIVVNEKLKSFLVEKYSESSILYINKEQKNLDDTTRGNFRINELVYGDRTLRHDQENGLSYLNRIQKPIVNFLKINEITTIFGEVTWAHEILIHRIVSAHQELKAKFYCPHTIRIPAGRFGFFEDECQSKLVKSSKNKTATKQHIQNTIDVIKPEYLALNDLILKKNRKLKARLNRIKRFISMENIDPKDPTIISSRWTSFKLRCAEEFNREAYSFVKKSHFTEKMRNTNYVFLGLHKQPEASIDVIGRYYEDQLTNIKNIWRALPDDWFLLVKEHSNAVGDRSWFFYRSIQCLKNVILLDEKTDSHEIIKSSRAVLTVSGTAAYEAALMGIPSLTFGDVFFNRIKSCQKINLESLLENDIPSLIKNNINTEEPEFSKWIYEHSAIGLISDPVSNPNCMLSRNIEDVALAFKEILSD